MYNKQLNGKCLCPFAFWPLLRKPESAQGMLGLAYSSMLVECNLRCNCHLNWRMCMGMDRLKLDVQHWGMI